MALTQNQPKRGTQHSTSTNKTQRTGRDSGFGKNTSKHGVEHRVSKNPTKRTGSDPQASVAPTRGIGRGSADRGSAAGVDRLKADGVGRELPSV